MTVFHLAGRYLDEGKSIAAIAVGIVISVVVSGRVSTRTAAPRRYVIATFVSLTVMVVATLQTRRAGGGLLDRNPFNHLSFGRLSSCYHPLIGPAGLFDFGSQAMLNVALFIPFGVFATLAFQRASRVVVWAVLLAIALEFIQTIFDLGVCEVLDVTHNILGAVVGVGAVVVARRPRPRISEISPRL